MPLEVGAPSRLAVAVAAVVLVSGCAQIGQIRAQQSFKEANQAYQAQDYKKAADLYEQTIQANPDLNTAYFFLGNSYDQLWKPSKKGEAANDELLQKAVDNYQKSAERLVNVPSPEERRIGRLALEYLVATYGADKLNDPAKAEPVVQRMIQNDPTDTGSYFVLARIYQDAGLYDEAEKIYLLAKDAKPGDPAVYMQLAGFYNGQGDFAKTIDALQQRAQKEPTNPEAFYTIATYYWDEAYRDPRVRENEKKEYVKSGIEAIDHALQLKADYAEALIYKGLLLRLQANIEKDPSLQQSLIKQADALRDRAQELRKQKAAGAGD